MKFAEVLQELRNRDSVEELGKRRFACASCGATWVEIVGLVFGREAGKEDLCLRIGMESEACHICNMKTRKCQGCGSKDVYELRFEKNISDRLMVFSGIKTVSKGAEKSFLSEKNGDEE